MSAIACVKQALTTVVFGALFTSSAFGNESFSIMNDRLGSALQDNANNHQADQRVNDAYNAAKQAIEGSMDTSNASAISSVSSTLGSSTNDNANAHTASIASLTTSDNAATTAATDNASTSESDNAGTGANSTSAAGTGESDNAATTAAKDNASTGESDNAATGVNSTSALSTAKSDNTSTSVSPTVSHYGIQTNSAANPVTTPDAIVNATVSTPANPSQVDSINVDVDSLKPSTPVTATVNGITQTITAGELSHFAPAIQVSVPHIPALMSSNKSNHSDRNSSLHTEGHIGRGSDNAHSHAFGGHGYGHDNSKSEGFGGHSHFH